MNKPALLYKYSPISIQTLENIHSNVIFFGSVIDFNDPYDCALPVNIKAFNENEIEQLRKEYLQDGNLTDALRNGFNKLSNEDLHGITTRSASNALQGRIELFRKENGVSCFSETNNNLLMWSHYADKAKGMCLEFDTNYEPFSKMKKVKYSDFIPEINMINIALNDEATVNEDDEFIINLFATKSNDWKYEQEWRVLHNMVRTSYHYDINALIGIYFGPDSPNDQIEIVRLITEVKNSNVKLWKGMRSKKNFSVEFSPLSN